MYVHKHISISYESLVYTLDKRHILIPVQYKPLLFHNNADYDISNLWCWKIYIFLVNDICHMPRSSLKIILVRFSLWKLLTFKTHNHAFQKIYVFCHSANFTCNEIFNYFHNTTLRPRVACTYKLFKYFEIKNLLLRLQPQQVSLHPITPIS